MIASTSAARPGRGGDVAAVAVLILLPAAFLAPAMLANRILGQYPGDGTRVLYIAREYLLQSLREGRLPLWNPYTQFGAPFLADIQWGVFYPVNLLLIRASSDVAYNLSIAIHLALAGVCMYALSRQWEMDCVPALLTSLAFAFSGRVVMMSWAGNVNMLSALAWIPLVVLLTEQAIIRVRGRAAWVGIAGVAFSVQILSGHPQFTFFCGVILLVLALWHGGVHGARAVAIVGAIAVIGAGLAAVQLLPTYEAAKLSTRTFDWAGTPVPFRIEGSYNPIRLLTWIVPDGFGNPVELRPASTDWLSVAFHEVHSNEFTGYIGVLPLALAAFSLKRWREESRVRFLWYLTAIGFVFAFGQFALAYGLLYAVLPPLRTFRIPARFLTISIFSLALLAGCGAQSIFVAARASCRRWAVLLAVIAVLIATTVGVALALRSPIVGTGERIASPLFASSPSGSTMGAEARRALIGAAFGLTARSAATAALVMAASAGIFWLAASSRTAAPRLAVAMIAVVLFDLGLNAWRYSGSESMSSYFRRNEPIVRALRAAGRDARTYTLQSRRVLDIVLPNDNAFIHERLHSASGYDSFELRTYHDAIDRLDADLRSGSAEVASSMGVRFVVADLPLPSPAFRLITRSDVAALYENLQTRSRTEVMGRDGSVAGSAVIDDEAPEAMTVTVHADRDAQLVVNDTYYPGWLATVDGVETPVLAANGNMRAVAVSRGTHTIRWRFSSGAVVNGAWISLVTAAATLLLMLSALRTRHGVA